MPVATAVSAPISSGDDIAPPHVPSQDEDFNNGEDFTRPPDGWDLRYQFQYKGNDVEQNTFTLRRDQPYPLGDRWKLATRFDIPFVQNDRPSRDNPDGDKRAGTGDVLLQAALVDTVTDRFAVAGGIRALFPTATEDQFGSGKYRLLPILGAREKLPRLSIGSFVEVVARYDFDVGGYRGRSHVSQVQFSPTFNVALPDRWFVTLFPSQDFVANLIGSPKWFVPADFAVGRNINERTVASLEVSMPIVKEYLFYNFKLEARIGFTF